MMIQGSLTQAISIITLASTFKVIPYIVYDAAYYYLRLVSSSLSSSIPTESWMLWTCVAYALTNLFDYKYFSNVEKYSFLEACEKTNFYSNLQSKISQKDFDLLNLDTFKITEIVSSELNNLHSSISSQNLSMMN